MTRQQAMLMLLRHRALICGCSEQDLAFGNWAALGELRRQDLTKRECSDHRAVEIGLSEAHRRMDERTNYSNEGGAT